MALTLLPNNAMTFTENQHGTAVLEKLRSQRELVRCCDVILHVAGLQFQAHRCVLAACSPYFDSIFKASKTVKEQLTISSQDPEVFRCLLAYMYTGTVVVDKTNVAELLRLANKLLIAKLKDHCAEYLERYLDATNCLTVRDMATKFHLEALQKTTGNFISSHLNEVIEGEEILDLSHSRLEDFLRNPSWHLQEDQTLLLVTRWVNHCPNTRERNLRSLLTWVRWCHLDCQVALQLMQTHPLYSGSNSLLSLFFLMDVLNDNSLLPEVFINSFLKLKAKYCQPTDSIVDNESFLSLAISTAIDELQDDQVGNNRPQEAGGIANDLCSNLSLPAHSSSQGFPPPEAEKGPTNVPGVQPLQNGSDFPLSLRRSCEEQEDHKQQAQYEMMCRGSHNADEMHLNPSSLIFPHQGLLTGSINKQDPISDDSIEAPDISQDEKFSGQKHFNQTNNRNMSIWHQEASYGNDSLSSDSGGVYQKQIYEQGFNHKIPCSDAYNVRINPNTVYSTRENMLKNKQNFAHDLSSMSYYVSTYNPDNDMTVSDDQSTQSFQYEENFNSGMNLYSCRMMEMKDPHHSFMEPTRNQEEYAKSYYPIPNESSENQNIGGLERELYYNENSTDTQLSNCPQDMTIQNQYSNVPPKPEPEIFPKSVSNIEDLNDVSQNDSNMPVSLVTEQQTPFDHYSVNDSMDVQTLQRDVIETDCEPSINSLSRDLVAEKQSSRNIARNNQNCDEDMNNFTFVKEGLSNQKDKSDDISGDEVRGFMVTHEQEQVENIGDIHAKLPQNNDLHIESCGEDMAFRHNKFKIDKSVATLPSNTLVKEKSKQYTCVVQNLQSDDLDPDDPGMLNREISVNSESVDFDTDKHSLNNAQENQEEDKGGTKPPDEITSNLSTRRRSVRSKASDSTKATKTLSVNRVCDVCQSNFTQNREYFRHMKEHFVGPPHCCDTCDASFKRIYYLLDHRITHQENRNYKCPHCSFSSHKKYNLTEHLEQHTTAGKYKCKTCGAKFHRLQILKAHESVHSNERPFLCESCGWSGKTKNNLIVHTKRHTGDMLKCQFSSCNYETTKKSHLKEHMLKHSKTRPCVCTVCGRTFILSSHLRRHMKIHLSEKTHKCFECDYASVRTDYLKIHIKRKHDKSKVERKSRKKEPRKEKAEIHSTNSTNEVPNIISAHIECSQGDIFSDLENTNVSLQPQLPGTPPPTTLTEYPSSPTYNFQPHSGPEDTLMIVPDMSVTDSFAQIPHSSPLHRNLTSGLNYDESYHSPPYQSSPSHFAPLSPTNPALSYTNSQHQEESHVNFAAYMKYD